MRAAFITFLCSLAVAGACCAQDPPAGAPSSAGLLPGSRVLRTFDFEERKLGNYESVPMYWAKVTGRGFPAYSTGAFDRGTGGGGGGGEGNVRSGETSFKLETSGGSVAYRFAPPPEHRITVYPDADYYVVAFVRTSALKHARADIAAWFADDAGNLLPGTETHSLPYAPVTGADKDDAWRVLYLYLPGRDPSAPDAPPPGPRSLVLQLGLMQPQQLGGGGADHGSPLGRFEIYQQDIEGAAWFDDITVFQLPRVSVSVPRAAAGNIFPGGQKIELDMIVSDLGVAGEGGETGARKPLDVRLKITDAEGLVFASERYAATTSPERAWTLHYTHAPLPAGKYTATLEVMDGGPGGGGGLIARRQAEFLCLPPAAGIDRPAAEFGLGFDTRATRTGAPAGTPLEDVPALAKHAGAGLVQLPAWRREMSEDALTRRDATLDATLATLQRLDIRTIGTFSAIPGTLAKRLPVSPDRGEADRDSILALLTADAAVWRPYISFALTRYANRIDFWQLGAPDVPFSGSASAFGPELSERYIRLYERAFAEMTGLMDRRQLLIPWNALFEFDPKSYPRAVLDLRLPAVIKPGQIPAYLDNFRQAIGAPEGKPIPLFAHLEASAETSRGSHRERLADFAQRVVLARTANPQGILYDVGGGVGGADELFLVYRTLTRTLGNSAYVGELPLGSGLRALLFNRSGSGTLILWNEGGETEEVPLDLPLGATPRLTDLVGNPQPVAIDPMTGRTHVTVTATPLVLDGLDPRPLQLQSSYSLSTPSLPAGAGSVRTEVSLTNPYAETLSGTLRFMPPRGWTADPPSLRLNIPAGKAFKGAVTIRYPFTENAGIKHLDGRLTLEQNNTLNAQQLDVSYPIAVTSERVELDGFAQVLENGDIVVQGMVTNISDKPLDAQAYVLLPGFPRQQRYVAALPPGQTAIKRFQFPAGTYVGTDGENVAARALRGQAATLGLRQNDGKTLLTRAVPLE
jgi:hypothetical protein